MKCEKLGVSVAFLSAIAFMLGWYSIVMALVIMLVVVCVSDNDVLRKNAMTAFLFSLVFWGISLVLSFLTLRVDDAISFIMDFVSKIFGDDYTTMSKLNNIEYYLYKFNLFSIIGVIVDIVKFVLMVIFVIMSFKGKEVKAPLFYSLALKAFGLVPAKVKKEQNPITSEKETLEDIPKSNEDK